MKRKYRYQVNEKTVEREYTYIPFRYIVAVLITLLEVLAIAAVLCITLKTVFGCTKCAAIAD